jgi:hypothetical protein
MVQPNVRSSARTPFHPLIALLIALLGAWMGGLLGATLTLAVTTTVDVEWTLRLVMAAHAAFSFGILGGWLAASFAMDDRDDTAAILSLPIEFAGTSTPGVPPRIAA